MEIAIRTKDTPNYLRGVQVLNHEIMNDLIDNSLVINRRSHLDYNNTYVTVCKDKVKTKFIFSVYEDIKYKFKLGKLAGPAYRWFIEYYPLNFEADSNGTKMFQIKGAEVWTNPKFNKQKVKCWAYDINSAYPAALLKPIPDVNNDLGPGTLFEGQIGFNINKEGILEEVTEGFANWRFNLIPSPWAEKYVPKKYAQLLKAKAKGDKDTAQKIKDQFNISIGVLRNHNAFLYTHIITQARNATLKYVDENTISVNTDCIYSSIPRKDIPLGSEIGQFKELEENGSYIYFNGSNYLWESGKGAMRGIGKELQETYDLENQVQLKKPDYIIQGGKIIKNEMDT